ncbi:MAG: hypothetical protein IPJ71_14420 [Bdellovibrionales bacterium]|nr:hypothetical protein [Bdellovibrionales bacterium]
MRFIRKTSALFLIVLFIFGSSVGLAHSRRMGADLGIGWRSDYGLLGLGGRYFIAETQDFHLTAGFDVIGLILGLGSRRYFQPNHTHCFFMFECEPRYFIGVTLLKANGASISIEGDGLNGKYSESGGYGANFSTGFYDTFGESFTMGLEVGYRLWLDRPTIHFESGTYLKKHQNSLEEFLDDSFTASLTFGWSFL